MYVLCAGCAWHEKCMSLSHPSTETRKGVAVHPRPAWSSQCWPVVIPYFQLNTAFKKKVPSCTIFWCLLDFTCICSLHATLSCQSTWRSTKALCWLLTLPRRCIPGNMRITLWMSTPVCVTFGWTYVWTHVRKSSCAVILVSNAQR